MMLLIALALATMPKPIGPPVSTDLTAVGALVGETRPGSTRVEVTVDPDGQPQRCDVVASDGVKMLDRAACSYLMRRVRYAPARDAGGAPIAAVVRVDLTANHGPAASPKVDYALQVAKLPGTERLAIAEVIVTTAPDGHVTACDVAGHSGSDALDRLACRQIAATAFSPAQDRRKQPVAALREVSIGFTAGTIPQ